MGTGVGNLAMDLHPIKGGVAAIVNPSRVVLRKPELSTGLIGHSAPSHLTLMSKGSRL